MTGYNVALDPSEWEKCKPEQTEAAASGEVIDKVVQLDSEKEDKPTKRKRDSAGGASARKQKTSTAGDGTKKALPKSRKGRKKQENVESHSDGKADEDVGTNPPPKRDKEESTMRVRRFLLFSLLVVVFIPVHQVHLPPFLPFYTFFKSGAPDFISVLNPLPNLLSTFKFTMVHFPLCSLCVDRALFGASSPKAHRSDIADAAPIGNKHA